jgi:hypothetical protein
VAGLLIICASLIIEVSGNYEREIGVAITGYIYS